MPTPLRKTGDPDLSYILAVSDSLKEYVHKGMVIVLESTTYPGTTREMILPKLEESGMQVGKDFFLAFSPERVDPGRTDWTTTNTPKVLGGITPACLEVSKAWYGSALETVVPVSSAEVAEMAKLLENTFRMINIGMVNEMAIMCDRLGVDVWEVIEAAATKPFGYMKFLPGPGLGGHCIPIDPLYLSWKLKTVNYSARFIELASEINTSMPRYTVSKVQDALNTQQESTQRLQRAGNRHRLQTRISTTCAKARRWISSTCSSKKAPRSATTTLTSNPSIMTASRWKASATWTAPLRRPTAW